MDEVQLLKIPSFKSGISLKNQLLIYFVLVAFVPAGIIGLYYFINSQKALEESIGNNNYMVVNHIMENIEKQMEQAINFVEGIYVNQGIIELLRSDPGQEPAYNKVKIQAVKSLEDQFNYLPVTRYIDSFFIVGNNGMVLRNGPDAYSINVLDFVKEDWYLDGKKQNGKTYWGSMTKNSTRVSNDEYIVPMFKLFKDIGRGTELGSMVILFSEKIFSDNYKTLFQNNDTEIYLMDPQGNIISTNQRDMFGGSLREKDFYETMVHEEEPYFLWNSGKESKIVVHRKSEKTGWVLVEVISPDSITKQKESIRNTALLLVAATIFMAILFSTFLSWNFARPINKLVKQVNKIAQGNFSLSIGLKNKNELGVLGKNIEKMASDIQVHIEKSLQKEEEKRKIEIRMLQSQINPHFLYNTLSSIKWMAAIQGAEGIREMAACLGRLLKAAVGDINQEVSVGEELHTMEDYIHIQKIRYKGKIRFHKDVADERLLTYSIVKFTLQPIIENAIFHGIEPKDGIGDIKITVCEENEKLRIAVWDNGVGMSPDRIKEILTKTDPVASSRGLKGIGLSNVNQRIKLIYGEGYGIDIESTEGEYTRVSVVLPAGPGARREKAEVFEE